MHTVEMLEQALALAGRLGYKIRQEWLGGSGGGACEIAGQKCFFVDLAVDSSDQLDQLVETLQGDPGIYAAELSPELRSLLGVRKSA